MGKSLQLTNILRPTIYRVAQLNLNNDAFSAPLSAKIPWIEMITFLFVSYRNPNLLM